MKVSLRSPPPTNTVGLSHEVLAMAETTAGAKEPPPRCAVRTGNPPPSLPYKKATSARGSTFGTAYAAAARAAARAQLRDAPVSDHPHGRAARQQHRARMDTHERRCASAPVYEDLLLATALPCRRRAAELRAARGAHALQCSTFPGRARREAAPALSQQPHRVEPSDLASSRRTRGGEQLDAREPRLDGDGAQL